MLDPLDDSYEPHGSPASGLSRFKHLSFVPSPARRPIADAFNCRLPMPPVVKIVPLGFAVRRVADHGYPLAHAALARRDALDVADRAHRPIVQHGREVAPLPGWPFQSRAVRRCRIADARSSCVLQRSGGRPQYPCACDWPQAVSRTEPRAWRCTASSKVCLMIASIRPRPRRFAALSLMGHAAQTKRSIRGTAQGHRCKSGGLCENCRVRAKVASLWQRVRPS